MAYACIEALIRVLSGLTECFHFIYLRFMMWFGFGFTKNTDSRRVGAHSIARYALRHVTLY